MPTSVLQASQRVVHVVIRACYTQGWADFTKAQKDKWRYEKWQAKIAAKKAAEEAAAPTETES